jgi:phospholipid transport system substrate-binding protein
MKPLRTFLIAPLFLATTLAFSSVAFAGPAQDHLRTKHGELLGALRPPPSKARTDKVEALLDGMIDFEKLARDSLGTHYQGRTEPELTEFRRLLEALVKKNYRNNIEKTLDYQITYVSESRDADGVLVRTQVKRKKKDSQETETVAVNYRLHSKSGRWLIYDVITEDSSMLRNYRNQFNKIISKNDFATLLQKLQRKLNEA